MSGEGFLEGFRALRSLQRLGVGPGRWSIWQHPNHLCVRKGSGGTRGLRVWMWGGECVCLCVGGGGLGGRGGRKREGKRGESERAGERARAQDRESMRATFSSEREGCRERETLTE
jgi:hypothetical protein